MGVAPREITPQVIPVIFDSGSRVDENGAACLMGLQGVADMDIKQFGPGDLGKTGRRCWAWGKGNGSILLNQAACVIET